MTSLTEHCVPITICRYVTGKVVSLRTTTRRLLFLEAHEAHEANVKMKSFSQTWCSTASPDASSVRYVYLGSTAWSLYLTKHKSVNPSVVAQSSMACVFTSLILPLVTEIKALHVIPGRAVSEWLNNRGSILTRNSQDKLTQRKISQCKELVLQ
ncbi:hypothetical protein CONLIGDRAFT_629638 [Coniochaeta ligniaria NRRL 30616]|uniref:Uncharacterized protein n=1 Tax=Coniochaeta ligniaria NRRL 30616 TaxID=1408157 RepID=A0A1J7IXB7_9PEZI|nr:hypothetical protein CONLIGDRAFT_629638 [Coniochaeta ligniaria NRRL 30616]